MKDTSASPIPRVLLPPRCVVTETTRYYYYFFVEPSFPSFKERNIGGGRKRGEEAREFLSFSLFFLFYLLERGDQFLLFKFLNIHCS